MVVAMYTVEIAVEHQSIAFAFDAQKLQMMQMGKRNELFLLQNNMLMIDIQLHFAGIHPYKFIQRFVFQKIRVFMERIGQDDPPLYFRILKCPFHGILIFNFQIPLPPVPWQLSRMPPEPTRKGIIIREIKHHSNAGRSQSSFNQ